MREIDGRINAGVVLDNCDEEGAELEGKAFDLPVYLHFNPHLQSRAFG